MSCNFSRENKATAAKVTTSTVYATGTFKNVYKGKYNEGERAGQECVCKIFKSGSVFKESYFQVELQIVAKTLEIVNSFNKCKLVDKPIWLNQPEIWTFRPGSSKEGEKALVEPMISNFEKFNSNTGWTPEETSSWIDVMQALSHFSYYSSNRLVLLCDLQGGIYRDGFVITDPVVMSESREYGPTDLGPDGIATFFAHHKCSKYCRSNWMTPSDKNVYFKLQKGSAMSLPTRQSRAPLTQLLGNLSIQEEEED